MAKAKLKKVTKTRKPKKTPASLPLDPLRTGMPALDSITGVDEFKEGKKIFRIIHTNEVDEYERAPAKVKRKKQ